MVKQNKSNTADSSQCIANESNSTASGVKKTQTTLQVSTINHDGRLQKAGLILPEKAKAFNLSEEGRAKYLSNLDGSNVAPNTTNNKQQPTVSAGLSGADNPPSVIRGVDNLSFVDFIRCTVGDNDSFDNFVFSLKPLLERMNIVASETEKGMIGYKVRTELVIGSGKDSILVGNLATGNVKEGGLFELSGKGCTLIRLSFPELWLELYSLLVENDFKVTRVDVALDFQGDYAIEKGYTIANVGYAGLRSDLFRKDTQKGDRSLSATGLGDLMGLWADGTSMHDYDPLTQSQKGLTIYFGNRKSSPDFFRVYEKGKEQNETLPVGDIERAYFRIEHEMKRPDGKTIIPLDVMIRPDAYFGAGRSNLRALLDEMKEYYAVADIAELQRHKLRKQKTKLLSKKVDWLQSTGGRVIKTLQDYGASDSQIVQWLTRPEGIKEFINDLDSDAEFNVLESMIFDGLVPAIVKTRTPSPNNSLPVNQESQNGVYASNG